MGFRHFHIFLLGLLACALAALAMLLPSWLGAYVAAQGTPERNAERAAADFLPLLEEQDQYFGQEEDDESFDEEQFWNDLLYMQGRNRPVVAVFKSGLHPIEFSGVSTIHRDDTRRRTARLSLQKDGDVDDRLRDLVTRLESEETPRQGVCLYPVDAPVFQVVWRKTGEQTEERTTVQVFGFVVDYAQTDDLLAHALWPFLGALGACMLCLLVISVGVLVHLLRQTRRSALQKTTFVSNVSHELRTPLTSLLSYAEMLQAGRCRTEEKRRKALDVILDEGRRLNRMILELLEFNRLERGVRRYRSEAFDLAETVRRTAERLSGRFAAHGLELGLPGPCVVHSDEDTVRQVLENLLTNAAKYAAKGGPVKVSFSVRDGRVRVVVADRGPGLTRWQMRQAFKPFWRADDSVTKETGGYGIGLSVARAHARGLGGDLTVAARPGGGCAFTFEIPVSHKEEEGK